MHGTCIKIIEAQHTKFCNNYKNNRTKLLETNAAIWFNKIRKTKQVTPKYFRIKINGNLPQTCSSFQVKHNFFYAKVKQVLNISIFTPFFLTHERRTQKCFLNPYNFDFCCLCLLPFHTLEASFAVFIGRQRGTVRHGTFLGQCEATAILRLLPTTSDQLWGNIQQLIAERPRNIDRVHDNFSQKSSTCR